MHGLFLGCKIPAAGAMLLEDKWETASDLLQPSKDHNTPATLQSRLVAGKKIAIVHSKKKIIEVNLLKIRLGTFGTKTSTYQPGMAAWNCGYLQEANPKGRDSHQQRHDFKNMLHWIHNDKNSLLQFD